MTYFKVDDKLHDHRKTRRARRDPNGGRSAAAIGLWVQAGSWCRANDSDGFVPADELDRWDDNGEQLAERLVDAKLWHHAEHEGEPGYQFHEWDSWQHTTEYLNERRRRNAARMRTARANEAAAQPEQPDQPEDQAEDQAEAPEQPEQPAQPKAPKAKRKTPADKAGDDFARFWDLYPRKTGKQDAARAFMRATEHTEVAAIAEGLHNALQVWKTTETPTTFIPHPATWLNQGRWDDEQPLEGMPGAPAPTVTDSYDLPPLPTPPDEVAQAGGKAYTEWAKRTRAEQRAELAAARGGAA